MQFRQKHLQAGTSTKNTCRQVLPPKTPAGRYFRQKHQQADISVKNICRQALPPKTFAGRYFRQQHLQASISVKKTPAGRCSGLYHKCSIIFMIRNKKKLNPTSGNYAQNVCLQVFWTHQAHYETCCNLLKTSACKCFGHTRHNMNHAVTCSKRLPAGVLDTPGTI